MPKEYSYNGKKYIWITDNLDRTKGCHTCHFIDDADGCYVMDDCATVRYSYFVEVNTETKERIKEAMDTTYEYEGKYYKLLADKVDESTCKNCVLEDDEVCREASKDCGAYGYFVLYDKTKESKGDMSALNKQEGGDHYKNLKIQPVEYITANNMSFLEGNVIKYISRHSMKNGIEDIKKVIHYCELILQLQYNSSKENK